MQKEQPIRLWPTIGPFIRGKIRHVFPDFPYKRYILSKIRRDLAKTCLILEQPLTPVLTLDASQLRREKNCINDLRVFHKTRTHSTHTLIFGTPRWIAVATGNIYMKTSQEQK